MNEVIYGTVFGIFGNKFCIRILNLFLYLIEERP